MDTINGKTIVPGKINEAVENGILPTWEATWTALEYGHHVDTRGLFGRLFPWDRRSIWTYEVNHLIDAADNNTAAKKAADNLRSRLGDLIDYYGD